MQWNQVPATKVIRVIQNNRCNHYEVLKPLALIILDGWGFRSDKKDNGIAQAATLNFDRYFSKNPHTTINASGHAVGLPEGIMGNSEVGHMNLGAGRIIYSGLSQIYRSIEDGSFYKNPALLKAIRAAKENSSALHLMGLVSDGAVHSHQDHLYALLDLAKKEGLKEVFIHCLMDGRDTPPNDGIKYIRQLEEQIKKKQTGKIASVSGRYYAMDRDKRWERINKAYDILTGTDKSGEPTAEAIVSKSYKEEIGDEFIVPKSVIGPIGPSPRAPFGVRPIKNKDAVIFFNFRADRAKEITKTLTDPNFSEFERRNFPKLSAFVCMAPYDKTFTLPVAYKPIYPEMIFPQVLSDNGLKQLRIAETEKYAHVTYFFNGGQDKVFQGEKRVLIPSPREVPTYDLKPEMSAKLVTNEVCKKINSDKFDVIILNFANPDMVGHTAKPRAIIRAVETVDECLGKVVELILKKGGHAVVTADHGNAEQMVDDNGEPHTAHTLNPVPFIVISKTPKKITLKKDGGRLCDVAPTLLDLLGIKKPGEMGGESLIC